MEKKIIAVAALTLALVLLFVACGKAPTITTKEGYEYPLVTDEEGNTVVDANGDLVVYVTDENGKYVEDANGEPQTNAVTFPDKIVEGNKIETSLYTWSLPKGWSFDEDGKAVKDGSEGNIYIKLITIDEEGATSLDAYVEEVYNITLAQAEQIKSTYPDTVVSCNDVKFSASQTEGKSLVVQMKDSTGTMLRYVDGVYFMSNGTIYKIEYACLNGYFDETVDLYAMLQDFTLKA